MKTLILRSIFLFFSLIILNSCSGDDLEELTSAEYNAQISNGFIYDSNLVGEWKINAMITNKEIDLNGDGVKNNDILLESSCFEAMKYTFRGNKTFTVINPMLELKSENDLDQFKCQSATTISGKWSVKDDMLTLYIKTNNQEYTVQKQLILTEDTFFLEINQYESMDYIYDRGNSSASGLSIVVLEFSRNTKK